MIIRTNSWCCVYNLTTEIIILTALGLVDATHEGSLLDKSHNLTYTGDFESMTNKTNTLF